MIPVLNYIKGKIVSACKVADEVMRGKAVETVEYEVEELDNIFAIPNHNQWHKNSPTNPFFGIVQGLEMTKT